MSTVDRRDLEQAETVITSRVGKCENRLPG